MKRLFGAMMFAGVLMMIGSAGVDEIGGDVLHALTVCVRGLGLYAAGGVGLMYKTWLDETRAKKKHKKSASKGAEPK